MDYKKKYLKYKSKYLYSKKNQTGGTLKKLYCFRPTINYDDQILIVKAINEDDAFVQLSKINNNHELFIWKSEYAKNLSIDEIKKNIYENKIKPEQVKLPFLFMFYNG